MFFSVVVTVYEKDQAFLPRVLTCLRRQSFRDFEAIIVVDGEEPLSPYEPGHVRERILPEARVVQRPRSRTMGYCERRHAMGLASAEYIAWVNADNLLYPDWLLSHHSNICQSPGCVSVVNIDYWRLADYWGVLPTALAHGRMDLLNYALPLALARRLAIFGPEVENLDHADWIAFDRCSREAEVVWDPAQPVCAAHF